MKKRLTSLLVAALAIGTISVFAACGNAEAPSGGGDETEEGGVSGGGGNQEETPHSHTFDRQVVESKYLKSGATCTTQAVYYYSCACGEKGEETFESGGYAHNYQNGVCVDCGRDQTSEGLVFTLCDSVYWVTGIGTCEDTEVVIPAVYNGKPVTEIGVRAFSNCARLTSVTIPDCVIKIGDYAFNGCKGLTQIAIPDELVEIDGNSITEIYHGVYEIGDGAFAGCSGLSEITVPNCVTRIGKGAFENCSGLTSISLPFVGEMGYENNSNLGYIFGTADGYAQESYIPESLRTVTLTAGWYDTIYTNAFQDCKYLTEINLPDGITTIGSYAFRNCAALTDFVVPDSVETIGSAFLYGSSELTSVTIGNGITSFDGWVAFSGCGKLKKATTPAIAVACLPKTALEELIVTSGGIGNEALKGCASLTKVTIREGVNKIGTGAFQNCSGLTSISVPDSVTQIGFGAFKGCSQLTEIVVPFTGETGSGTENRHFGYIFGASSFDQNSALPASLKRVTVTGGESICSRAFYGCSGLTSVTIPDSVTEIGKEAFANCSGLTRIVIPTRVTKIGDYAFYGCSILTEIRFYNSQTDWEKIDKGTNWDSGTGNYTVYCKDGDIAKSDSES